MLSEQIKLAENAVREDGGERIIFSYRHFNRSAAASSYWLRREEVVNLGSRWGGGRA